MLEWSGGEKETMEEGCLSLPGVHVDVERPIHVRVRAQDASGEPILIEASGLEARVIQHEMDHLDGVLILDRTSRDQRKEAMRTLARAPRGRLRHRLPRHLGLRRRRPRAPRRHATTARRSSSRAPTAPPGRGRKLTPPPVADAARELGLELVQPESVNDAEARERVAARGADVVVVCAFGALIKEPLLTDFELLNVHPSLLPRWRGAAPVERAIMAGDEETGVSIMRVTEGLDAGPVCLAQAEPIRARRRLRHARGAPGGRSAATCSCARSTSARRSPSSPRRA